MANSKKRQSALRELREFLGLTQHQMAERIGVTRARIGQVEAGDGTLSPPRIRCLVDEHRAALAKLGLTAESFLG